MSSLVGNGVRIGTIVIGLAAGAWLFLADQESSAQDALEAGARASEERGAWWADDWPIQVPSQVGHPEPGLGAPPDAVEPAPPMNGESIEGLVVEEADVPMDELGNTRVDSAPGSKEPESMSPEMEKRLAELSATREAMAEEVALEPVLVIQPPESSDAPPRMDTADLNPDRVNLVDSMLVEE